MLAIKKGARNYETLKTTSLGGDDTVVTTAQDTLSEQERECVGDSFTKHTQTIIQTKRTTMCTNKKRTTTLRMLQGVMVQLIALSLTAAVCFSQNMVNSGTISNTGGGVIKVKGVLTSSQSSYSGTVEFYGASQTVPALTYDTLKSSGSGTKSLATGKTTVLNNILVSAGTVAAASGSTDTLELRKQSAVPIVVTSGAFSASSGGVVNYSQPTQVIYGATYAKLLASGTGTKTTSGAVTVTGSVTTASSSDIIDFGSNAFTGTGATFANNGTLKSAGTVTLGSGTFVNGTFEYNASGGSQTVADAVYTGTLSLSNAGSKTVANVTIGDVYSVSGANPTYTGTVRYSKAGDQTIAAQNYYGLILGGSGTKTFSGNTGISTSLIDSVNTVISTGTTSLSGTATATFYNNLTVNGGFSAASGTTTTFADGAQTISGSASSISFGNLTLAGTAAKTSTIGINVAGTLTPTRGIDMGSSAILALAGTGTLGTFGSNEEIIGNFQRGITANAKYTMNNDSTYVTFASGFPSTFTVRVEPGTPPYNYNSTKTAMRKVTVSYASWSSGTAALTLGYKYSERPSANESTMDLFKYDGASTSNKITTGSSTTRYAATASLFGSLTLTGITPTGSSDYAANANLPSGAQIIMTNLTTYFIAKASTAWNLPSTWQDGVVPDITSDVQIPATFTVSTTTGASAASVVIAATGGLTLTNGLTVNSSLTNSGSITIPTGQTLQVAAGGSGTLQNNSGATITNSGTIQIGN